MSTNVCPVINGYVWYLVNSMAREESGQALCSIHLPDWKRLAKDSQSTWEVEQTRAYLLADRAVRVFAPMAFESDGYPGKAAELRALDPVADPSSGARAGHIAAMLSVRQKKWLPCFAAAQAASRSACHLWSAGQVAEDAAMTARYASKSGRGSNAHLVWAAARRTLIAALEVTA